MLDYLDHEPPERVLLSAYIQSQDRSITKVATEEFAYYLDQTCYLARYLADRYVSRCYQLCMVMMHWILAGYLILLLWDFGSLRPNIAPIFKKNAWILGQECFSMFQWYENTCHREMLSSPKSSVYGDLQIAVEVELHYATESYLLNLCWIMR